MQQPFHSDLRKKRRQYGLSQDDIACILGVHSRGYISMLESGQRTPSTEHILVLNLLFNEAEQALFPVMFDSTKEELASNIRALLVKPPAKLPGHDGRQHLLESALARLEGSDASEATV